ncbi:Kinesin-2 [Giardia muris]|uniref:Kinesin-like protein n=1 Tax=Giardia muris TaxID=5742 RepID=A0A4Z1SQA9_GIAMU|nr:Kinesin-2 [Giardia muris]|eukprot:TNJ27860.1 Kinesin-2 [Giardia muris]
MVDDNIKVVVRCRPPNAREQREKAEIVVRMDPSRAQVTLVPVDEGQKGDKQAKKSSRTFTFDAVYDQQARNDEIFEVSFKPLINAVLTGFNATIFAYGQTGAGKTWTMGGSKEQPGATPNSFRHIFEAINGADETKNFLVVASYLELYNEEIRDLLRASDKLPLKEHKDRGVYVDGLSQHRVRSADELIKLMDTGFANRHVAATQMNDTSSRSHSIFMVRIECSEIIEGKETIRVGKLNLVDLAGSERQSKTGATGDTLIEGAKINLSLSALGLVISKLVEGAHHIPYRDSKLTRLLQDSLGGNSKTLMCANISPASTNYDESLSTLRYADRAKQIKNKPKINEDPKDAQIRQLREHIAHLEAQLAEAQASGGRQADILRLGQNLISAIKGDDLNDESDEASKDAPDEGEDDESTEEEIVFVEDDASKKAAEEAEARKRRLKEEREQKLKELQEKQDLNDATITTLTDLKNEITRIKEEMFVAKELKSKVRTKNKELEETQKKYASRLEKENALKLALQAKQAEHESRASEVRGVVDRAQLMEERIAQMQAQIDETTQEIEDLKTAHDMAMEDGRAQLYEIDKRSVLLELITRSYIPPNEVARAERIAVYDEESMQWVTSPEKLAEERQALLRLVRRLQVVYPSGGTKPAFLSQDAGDAGFADLAHVSRNIMGVEPELPERLTVGDQMEGQFDGYESNLEMFYSNVNEYE